MGPAIFVSGIDAVHGCVYDVGSVTVNSYFSVSASMRVKRSTTVVLAVDPCRLVFRRKLIVSTTSVLPSQRPRESPDHWRSFVCGRPSVGMMRALWTISLMITTVPPDWMIWTLLLYAPGVIGGPELNPCRHLSASGLSE